MRAATCVARAVGAPYLKILGGALMVVGFGTSIFGFGFFLGIAGAGLVAVSTATSCATDYQKPEEEREGQVNVLLESAGWSAVGSILLIPYWIGNFMDHRAAKRNAELLPSAPSSVPNSIPTSPYYAPSGVVSPDERRPDPQIWQSNTSAAVSPQGAFPTLLPPLTPVRLVLGPPTLVKDQQHETSQSRAEDSSQLHPHPDDDSLVYSSSQSEYSVSGSRPNTYTDISPEDEALPHRKPPEQIVIDIPTLKSPNAKPLSAIPTTREEFPGVNVEWIDHEEG
jgi:hypothetical protein